MSLLGNAFVHVCKKIEQGTPLWNLLAYVYMYKKRGAQTKRQLLKMNKILKDAHSGERCFILGNGPSLKSVDFSLLEKEQVFTVNCLMEDEDFMSLKSNYHFWMDMNGFGLREDVKTDASLSLTMMKKLEKCKDIVFFVPADAYEVIREVGLDKNINVRYLETLGLYNQINKVDISKVSLEFSTVVQYAIEVAIYMGYKEIYLLGCDTTIIKSMIEVALGEEMSRMHAYEEDDDKTQENAFKQILVNNGVKFALEDTLRVMTGYEQLYDYCKKNQIKLVNLSEVTLIDCIPRDKLGKILRKKI